MTAQPVAAATQPRLHLIGASDAGTLIGCGYESPAFLYLRLRGEIEKDDSRDSRDAKRAGQLAEDGLLRPLAEERFGLKLVRATPVALPDEPRIGASPDFLVVGDPADKGRSLCQMKLTGRNNLWGPSGTREVPPYVLAQCQFEIAVCRAAGMPVFQNIVLVCFTDSGFEVRQYPLLEDRDVGTALILRAKEMLRRVEAGDPPVPGDEADARALLMATRGKKLVLDTAQAATCRELAKATATHNELGKTIKAMRDSLIPIFGDAEELIDVNTGEVLGTFKSNRVFDESAFRQQHPEMHAQACRTVVDRTALEKIAGKTLIDKFRREPLTPAESVRQLRLRSVGDE